MSVIAIFSLIAIFVSKMETLPVRAISTPTGQLLNAEEFWISVKLLNIEWKSECLSTAYCSEPELKVIKKNPINGEKISFAWLLDQNFNQFSNNPFISYWKGGSAREIEMVVKVVGVDPIYRFQRICDQTALTKIFLNELEKSNSNSVNIRNEQSSGQMIVELNGRCFEATFTVEKHITHCPWCVKAEKSALKVPFFNKFSPIKWNILAIVISALAVILCLVTAAVLLCTTCRHVKAKRISSRMITPPSICQQTDWQYLKTW
ncbi:unnamed protein product [Thelazia callipaeda]|uniref:C2 domain-containing protein n=1 Tax=Thelazia callipaeda TaxID=103827 RepID=A0A0N5CZA0_THECL|nr:unnamed protein product [Thelazia callipaeda]